MKLFIYGFGFSARALARRLIPKGWEVAATHRKPEDAARLSAEGVTAILATDADAIRNAIGEARAVLITAPPGPEGCPGLPALVPALARAKAFPDWLGYLSTTGVYGDHAGGLVTEETPFTQKLSFATGSAQKGQHVFYVGYPVEEVKVGWDILKSLHLRNRGRFAEAMTAVSAKAPVSIRVMRRGAVWREICCSRVDGWSRASSASSLCVAAVTARPSAAASPSNWSTAESRVRGCCSSGK